MMYVHVCNININRRNKVIQVINCNLKAGFSIYFIFIINSLVHIASACLLTVSFVSATTVILALLFITYNS